MKWRDSFLALFARTERGKGFAVVFSTRNLFSEVVEVADCHSRHSNTSGPHSLNESVALFRLRPEMFQCWRMTLWNFPFITDFDWQRKELESWAQYLRTMGKPPTSLTKTESEEAEHFQFNWVWSKNNTGRFEMSLELLCRDSVRLLNGWDTKVVGQCSLGLFDRLRKLPWNWNGSLEGFNFLWLYF